MTPGALQQARQEQQVEQRQQETDQQQENTGKATDAVPMDAQAEAIMVEAIQRDEGAVVQAAADLINGETGTIGDDVVARLAGVFRCEPEGVQQRVQVALKGYEGDAVRGSARAAKTNESLASEALQDARQNRRSDLNHAMTEHFHFGGTKDYAPLVVDYVALSLGTRRFREAEHLAEQLDAVFDRAVPTVTTPTHLRAIFRAYLEDALDDDTTMRLAAPPGHPVYGPNYDDPQRDHIDLDLDVVAYCISEAREALLGRDFRSVASTVERLMKEHSVPESARKALAYSVLEARVKLLEEIGKRILGEAPVVFIKDLPASGGAPAVSPPIERGPLFSEALPACHLASRSHLSGSVRVA